MKTTTSQSERLFKMTPTFGQAIRTAQVSIGYKRELAALVEVDFTYLSKLESDSTEYPPKEYVMSAIGALLGFRS